MSIIILDLGLNSTLDYDLYNNDLVKNILLGLFGIQVVVQISIFLVLFLATADTFLFRVGLIGVLIRSMKSVLLIHPIYFIITIITGIYRVRTLSKYEQLTNLWRYNSFVALSYIQKFGKYKYY